MQKLADLESLAIVWTLFNLRFEIESFAKRLVFFGHNFKPDWYIVFEYTYLVYVHKSNFKKALTPSCAIVSD